MEKESTFSKQVKSLHQTLFMLLVLFVIASGGILYYANHPDMFNNSSQDIVNVQEIEDEDLIENGIHVRTGLVDAEGLMVVVNNCTNCHSAKIITQNRMTKERWNATIKWMQETQNLWDLGGNQEIIVNYLVTNYPPKSKGRRMSLTNIEWYELED